MSENFLEPGKDRPYKWDELDKKQKKDFLLANVIDFNGQNTIFPTVLLKHWYATENWPQVTDGKKQHSKQLIEEKIELAKRKELKYYGHTGENIYHLLSETDTLGDLSNKKIAILGSNEPILEAIVLAHGAKKVTSIDYNKPIYDHEAIECLSIAELNQQNNKYDIAFSISSFEHDGLGTYGDPVDPIGDIKAMQNVKDKILKKDGILVLAVPIGQDTVVWNVHRIYGTRRLPILLNGWTVVGHYMQSEDLNNFHSGPRGKHGYVQPVITLRPKH